MFNTIIQIFLAIFVILILGFIAYSVYDRDYVNSIRIYNTNKKETKIFTGVYPLCATTNHIRLETMNRDDPYFVDINPSVNQNGGAEYSYNFWLYFNITEKDRIVNSYNDNTSIDNDKLKSDAYIVLFYKGVKQLIPYKQFDYSCDTKSGDGQNGLKYLLVKNPLVKITNDAKTLVVEYNNISSPDTYNSSAVKLNCSSLTTTNDNTTKLNDLNKNKLGIKNIDTNKYNKTYNMITIVMQESPSNEEALFTNRTNCKIYFNGTIISDRSTFNNNLVDNDITGTISTAMKKNLGSLYINPNNILEDIRINTNTDTNGKRYIDKINEITTVENSSAKDCPLKMADMSYFNYALSEGEIRLLYSKGFDNKMSDIGVRNMGLDKKYFIKGDKIDMNMYDTESSDSPMPVLPI
jgi:hypothetical protein